MVTTFHLKESKIRAIAEKTSYPRLTELILKVIRGHRQLAHTRQGISNFVEYKSIDEVSTMLEKIYDHILVSDTTATFYSVLKKPLRVNEDHKRENRTINTINRPSTYKSHQ